MNIFIDCGARAGETTLEEQKSWKKKYTVYLIEPNPYFAEQLKKLENEHPNFIFIPNAAWIEECEKELIIGISSQSGSSFYSNKGHLTDKKITVKCFDFSDWLKQFSDGDYIEIYLDTEGAEYEILSHMIEEGTIKKINKLTVEFHFHKTSHPRSDKMRKQHNEIIEYLEKSNIECTCWRSKRA